MKPLVLHPEAEYEVANDTEFYARRGRRLGVAFVEAVAAALQYVQENPEAGTPIRGNLRGWLLRRYPYTLIYREEAEHIYVLAIAPHRKRPGYWRERA